MKKSKWNDWDGRIRDIMSDPNNKYIPRHQDAGKKIDGHLVMHNGLKVKLGVYGELFKVCELNKGVHEPQEERVFADVLPYIKENGVMIELGAYWAFYSMWFYKKVSNAQCYMIEPESSFLEVGMDNFKLNNMKGDFTFGKVGGKGIRIDSFLKDKEIDYVDILHADIQGSEFEMLLGAKQSIKKGKIKNIFISSHTQELHYKCLDFLRHHGYIVIASADFAKQTYCHDGVLVARLSTVKGLEPINIALANWDTGSFFIELISRCPNKTLPKLYALYYCIKRFIHLVMIFLIKILPSSLKRFFKTN